MRRKPDLWQLAGGMLLLLAMMLAACSGEPPKCSSADCTLVVRGGTVIDAISQEPNSLLPQRSNQQFSLLVQTVIRSPLFATDDKGGVVPVLAQEVPSVANGGISQDGLTYTLRIRSGTKWSDGQPLTAADVLYTINLFRDPSYSARFGFFTASREISSVSQPDQKTIVITLKKVDAAFLALYFTDVLAFAPLPQHIYGSMAPADLIKSDESFKPTVTNGPFTVSDRLSVSITVVKNPNYFQPGKPYLDKIVFQIFGDSQTEINAIYAGQVDTAYFLPVSSYDTLKSIDGYSLIPSTIPASFEAWYLNVGGFQLAGKPATDQPLADPAVREALAISFDTKQEITQLWHDIAQPVCDPDIGTFGFDKQLINAAGYCSYGQDGKSFDNGGPTAAKALLDAAGWVPGADGIRVKAGHRLSLRIATTTGRKYREDSEALAQAAWKDIGVELKVDNNRSPYWWGPILFPAGPGDITFDIAESPNYVGAYPDDRLFFNSAFNPQIAGGNPGYYKNDQIDQLTNQVVQMWDPAQIKATQTQIHTLVNRDVPIIWLYGFPSLNEASNRLHDYHPSGIGPDETWNIAGWWLTGGTR